MSFWCLQFYQKTNENNSTWGTIEVKSNFFARFLGELKIPKRHFEINWPLAPVPATAEGRENWPQEVAIFASLHKSRIISFKKIWQLVWKKNPIINYKINDENLKSRHRKLKFSIYGAEPTFFIGAIISTTIKKTSKLSVKYRSISP